MLVWSGHKTKVRSLSFSPDGRRLASSAEQVNVKLWDATSGAAAGELKGRWGATSGVAFSPDGTLIATATSSSYVVLWDAETQITKAVGSTSGARYGPAFAADASCVAAVGWDTVSVWNDPAKPRPASFMAHNRWRPDAVYQPKQTTPGYFDSVAFAPDGRWVAANGPLRAVVWDRATGAVRRQISHPNTNALTVVAFAPDGRLAFTHSKVVEIHSLDEDGSDPVVLVGHTLFVRAIGFTPDGGTVMTAASDGTVRFWDARTGAPGRVFDWGIGRVYSAAFAPGGLTCAAGGEKGQIVVWDVD